MKLITFILLIFTITLTAQPKSNKIIYNKLEIISDVRNFSVYRNGIKCKAYPIDFRLGDAINIYIIKSKQSKNYDVIVIVDGVDSKPCHIRKNSKIKVITYKE